MPLPIEYDLLPGFKGSAPADFIDVNGTTYFTALVGSDTTSSISRDRRELWRINPTTGAPVRVTNIAGTASSVVSSVKRLINVNGTLFFRGQSGDVYNNPEIVQLWRIDPNTGNASIISGLPITVPTTGSIGEVDNLTNVNGTLYFTTFSYDKVWKLDPNSVTPSVVYAMPADRSYLDGILSLTNINNTLYFSVGRVGSTDANQLWRLDPNTNAPAVVAGMTPVVESLDQGQQFVNVNGTLYLSASTQSTGQELWKIDVATGRSAILEIVPGSQGSFAAQLTKVNNTLYFRASGSDFQPRLWQVNATTGAREIVGTAVNVDRLFNINNTLYFTASRRLWKVDPNTGTPVLFGPGTAYDLSYVSALKMINGTLYFRADSGGNTDSSLWKIDVNTGNPALVASGMPGYASLTNPIELNGKLYFTEDTTANGKELWSVDLASRTVRQLDIFTGATSASPEQLTIANGALYFVATNSNNGRELWTIDSVTGTPRLVSDINPGGGSSAATILAIGDGNLYLSATNGSNGQELWSLSLGNVAPIVANSIGPKTANEANLFTYQIPTTAFRDPNSGDVLTYSIRQSNGVGLPTWLSFNPQTRTLSGTPQTTTPLGLTVTATDAAGLSASDSFSLTITPTRNLVTGAIGNDTLVGTNGADRLIATGATRTPGYGEIDTITGTGGADMFVLGSSRYVFYDDSLYANAGWWRFIQQRNAVRDAGLGDYALIKDFNPGEGDKIQLKGNADRYQLGVSPIATKPGTAIFLIAGQQVAELIAVVQGTAPTSLTADYFSYV